MGIRVLVYLGILGVALRVGGAEEIVVTATRTDRAARNVAAAVTVIDQAAIRDARASTVDELFKRVAGVDLQGSGFPGSQVKLNLRGLTPGYQSKRVLVLVDGRRVNDAFQGNVEFAALPVDAIRRIEVIRGPASALYGSNAMGGVINIVTRRGFEAPGFRVNVEAGDYGTWLFRAASGFEKDRFDAFAVVSRLVTDGYADNSDGTDRDWESMNVEGNAGWRFRDGGELRAFAGMYRASGRDENSDREVRRDTQSLRFEKPWRESREDRFILTAYRNAQRDDFDWTYPGVGRYRLETLGADAAQSLGVGDDHDVTVGMEARRDSVDVNDTGNRIDENDTLLAVFAQDEFRPVETVTLTAGCRLDSNSEYGREWSPRLSVLWQPRTSLDLYASMNRAHRAPALSDRFVKTEFNGAVFEGNPELQPETLTAAEVGMRIRASERMAVELVGFFNRLDDSFDFILEADGVFRIRNVTRSRTGGLEASLRMALTPAIAFFANASYTDGEIEQFRANPAVEGNRPAYLAKVKAAAGLDITTVRLGRHDLTWRWVDERYGDAENTQENRMDDYAVLDWRSRVPLTERLSATLRVDNLLDESYEEFPGVEQVGRFVLGGAELTF